jgi:hypothetical protein
MSRPEASQPEAVSEVVRETNREELRESPPDPSQRQFLKSLFGGAAGIAGLAVAGELLNPTPAEAAYSVGGANTFPLPTTTGDLVNTNLRVDGHLAVKGYRPWADVTAFGALGDGSLVDSYVNAAKASLPADGGILYFPPGAYAFSNPLVVDHKHIHIMGAGRGATRLHWPGAGGIQCSFAYPYYKCTIRDLQLTTEANGASPAIQIAHNLWEGGETCQPHIHDVWIGLWGPNGYFSKGIELNTSSGAKIERFEIVGGPNMTHGIHLRLRSTIVNIASGLIFNHGGVGVEVSHESEGTYIRGVEVVGGHTGFFLNSPRPGSAISDCHAMTSEYGIRLIDHGEMALTGNLLYCGHPSNNWTGIHAHGTGINPQDPPPQGQLNGVFGPHRLRIIGNCMNVAVANSGTREGIRLTGYASDCTIQGNVIRDMHVGIGATDATTTNNIIMGNRVFYLNLPGTIVASGSNLVANNLTAATTVL